jgi:hypothetical protein
MTQAPREPLSKTLRYALAAALLALAAVSAGAAALGLVNPINLLRNGDFEETAFPPPGWTIAASTGESCGYSTDALTGKQALRFSLPVAGNVTATSDPCPVTGGEDYLLTFWSRGDGDKKEGGKSYCYLQWLDAAGKSLSNTLVTDNAPVPDYGVCTYTIPAPATATQAVIRLSAGLGDKYTGPPTAFLFDQVRLMHLDPPLVPPKAQTWQWLNRQLRTGLRMVPDPDAEQGQAIVAEPGVSVVGSPLTWGQYTTAQPPGDYLVIFRLKVNDNTRPDPVASLVITDIGTYNYVLAAPRTIKAGDFKAPNVYQDFPVRFVRPEGGMLEFTCGWAGKTELFFDKTTMVQLAAFPTDKQQAAIWLGE